MNQNTEHPFDVFISYNPADEDWVEGYLLDALRQAGIRCHTEAAFALGVPLIAEFERAILQSRRTLLVLSPAYQADHLNRFADLLAQSFGADTATWPVIPLILRPVDLPPRLRMPIGLDATDPSAWPGVIERLVAEFQRPLPPPPPPPQCPYPGMIPFTEADSDRFHGREAEVQELVERLRLHPFLAVIGRSGGGKSSLVFAGLLPALRASRRFGPGDWIVRSMRPGATPLPTLQAAIGDVVDPTTLRRTDPQAGRLLLIVDQFEEIFVQQDLDADPFQSALIQLADASGCYVVLTVRADFFADLLTCRLWNRIKDHRFELLPLDAAGLRRAIVRPAEDVGVYVEAALVERLLADAAGEPGVLPFVQETLALLWEHLERRFLPLRAYEALVLPSKAYQGAPRTGLQVAMARRADAALAALPDVQQVIARRIFLRLVQFGEGRADTRRQQAVEALRSDGEDPTEFDRVLAHLAATRLLTLGGDQADGNRKADIAHEALIKGWPTLAGWVADRREAELARRRLEAKADEWVRLGRKWGGLLDAAELAEADDWLVSADSWELGQDNIVLALVEASRSAISETDRAMKAAAQQRITLERRGTRWRVAAAGIIVLGLLAASVFVGNRIGLRQRAKALSSVIKIAAGNAVIGTTEPTADISSRPVMNVPLPVFSIGRTEVTNQAYCLCRKAGACGAEPAYRQHQVCDAAIAQEPVTNLTLQAASDFCQWIGQRIPTEIEWEWVARGAEGRRYPTGEETPAPGTVNVRDDSLSAAPNHAWAVGTAPADQTPDYGVLDMVGNVQEWTVSLWLAYDDPNYFIHHWPDQVSGTDDFVSGFVVARGGSWFNDISVAQAVARTPRDPGEPADDLGFRCLQGAP